jgi:hypothetical protein
VLIAERISVPGLTGKSAQATRGGEPLSAASNARSARVGFGCRVCRRSIASFIARHQDLELLRAARPRQQPDEREQVPHGEIRERPEQAALSTRQQER